MWIIKQLYNTQAGRQLFLSDTMNCSNKQAINSCNFNTCRETLNKTLTIYIKPGEGSCCEEAQSKFCLKNEQNN